MVVTINKGDKFEIEIDQVLETGDGNIYKIKDVPGVFLTNEQIEKLEPVHEAAKTIAAAIKNDTLFISIGAVAPGSVVKTPDGMKLQVLDNYFENCCEDDCGVLCITRDILFNKAFDDDNCNDWRKSTLRKYLNSDYMDELTPVFKDALIKFKRDLTSDDGMTDYGTCEDYVSLISDDEYRKYRYQISNKDHSWWTLTPYSCLSSSSNSARYVISDGSRGNNGAGGGYIGVSPAFVLSSSFMVDLVDGDAREEYEDE